MAWSKLDDGFHEHPKIVGMSDKAFRLYVSSITYSGRHDLQGRLTRAHLEVLFRLTGARQKHVDELLALGAFDQDGEDYRIHGFGKYNPTREDLSQKRAEAGRKGAESRWQNGKTMANAMANATPERPMAKWQNDGKGNPEPEPEPKANKAAAASIPTREETPPAAAAAYVSLLLSRGYSQQEIDEAKAVVRSRPKVPHISDKAAYLQTIMDERRQQPAHTAPPVAEIPSARSFENSADRQRRQFEARKNGAKEA